MLTEGIIVAEMGVRFYLSRTPIVQDCSCSHSASGTVYIEPQAGLLSEEIVICELTNAMRWFASCSFRTRPPLAAEIATTLDYGHLGSDSASAFHPRNFQRTKRSNPFMFAILWSKCCRERYTFGKELQPLSLQVPHGWEVLKTSGLTHHGPVTCPSWLDKGSCVGTEGPSLKRRTKTKSKTRCA